MHHGFKYILLAKGFAWVNIHSAIRRTVHSGMGIIPFKNVFGIISASHCSFFGLELESGAGARNGFGF